MMTLPHPLSPSQGWQGIPQPLKPLSSNVIIIVSECLAVIPGSPQAVHDVDKKGVFLPQIMSVLVGTLLLKEFTVTVDLDMVVGVELLLGYFK